jgi:hypothetical protein
MSYRCIYIFNWYVIAVIFDDPVAAGLVDSLSPGGAISRVSASSPSSYLQVTRTAVRVDSPDAGLCLTRESEQAHDARRAGSGTNGMKSRQLHIVKAGAEGEFESAFDSLLQLRADALIVGADPLFGSQRDKLVRVHRLRVSAVAGAPFGFRADL